MKAQLCRQRRGQWRRWGRQQHSLSDREWRLPVGPAICPRAHVASARAIRPTSTVFADMGTFAAARWHRRVQRPAQPAVRRLRTS